MSIYCNWNNYEKSLLLVTGKAANSINNEKKIKELLKMKIFARLIDSPMSLAKRASWALLLSLNCPNPLALHL